VEGGEGQVTLFSSIRDLLMGHVPGCANTAGTSLSLRSNYLSRLQNNRLNMLYLSKYFGIV
jgi:hypothetical protein